MNFNMQGALHGWASGQSDRYKAAEAEAAEIRRQERIYQTDMKKMKEMEGFRRQKDVQYREEDKGYEESQFEEKRRREGLLMQDEATFKSGQKDAEIAKAKQRFLDSGGTEEQWNERVRSESMGETAADKNANAVRGIMSKYPADVNPDDISMSDRLELASRGVTVPTTKAPKLTVDNKLKIEEKATKRATEEVVGTDDIPGMGDEEVLMEVNRMLPQGMAPIKDVGKARRILIDAKSGSYEKEIYTNLGVLPKATPKQKKGMLMAEPELAKSHGDYVPKAAPQEDPELQEPPRKGRQGAHFLKRTFSGDQDYWDKQAEEAARKY